MKTPSYALLWLVLNRRYGLLRKLGEGLTRETWSTRKGVVVKLPRVYRLNCMNRYLDNYLTPNSTESGNYFFQTEQESKLMARGTDSNGLPIAKGYTIHINGFPIIVMEHVLRLNDYFGHIDNLPPAHRLAYHTMHHQNHQRFDILQDGQWGYSRTTGQPVVYDAGCEE